MTTRLERIAGGLAATGPPDGAARAMVREAGVDTLGCVLGGAMVPDAMRARAALWSEAGGSPLFGTGATAAPSAAALLNALAGHALDFDDTEPAGNTHPSVVIFPALWAVAATRGAIPGETAAA
ncbi:MAG: MmgE/PrpD family protein, partial [Pseudomonadota bacterium]